jgi:hypothetical protein
LVSRPKQSAVASELIDHFSHSNETMHTVTSKQILSPVADAISQLIVLNAEAEMSNAPIPDLTGVAEAVADQVDKLVEVGLSMIEYGDKELKDEMPSACTEGMR